MSEKVLPILSNLVTYVGLGSHYIHFIEDRVKPTVHDVVDRINDDDLWKRVNLDILMHTRNSLPAVRENSLKLIDHLFERLGERYLILLNDTVPFLSECLEDEVVEPLAKAIIGRVEKVTGESIQEYLR